MFYEINIEIKRLSTMRLITHDNITIRLSNNVFQQSLFPHETTVTKTTISSEKNHFSLGKKIFLN
jgi:hypothetical protein